MSKDKTGVCLNMIVRNETAVLNRLFTSLQDHIDYWVIVDTGSTDGTQDFIHKWFEQAGIPGELHERAWVNFGHNRQQALELAVASGRSDWLLFIDADEELSISQPDVFRQLEPGVSYNLAKQHGDLSYLVPALVNIRENQWCWKAPVHEYLKRMEGPDRFRTLDGACILYYEGEGFRSTGKTVEEKFLGDARLLERHLKQHPEDSRSQFYLANSYRDAKCFEAAYAAYAKRCSMKGWYEEDFSARLQLGRMAIELKKSEDLVLEHLLDAFDFRPSRAEPLYDLARYFRLKDRFAPAMLYAKAGVQLPQPNDRLFVEDSVYQWRLLDELAVAAYWVGDFEASKRACEEIIRKAEQGMLLAEQELLRVRENLRFALEKLDTA